MNMAVAVAVLVVVSGSSLARALRQTGLAKLVVRWDPRERGWPGGAEAKPLAEAQTTVELPPCDNGWDPDPGEPGNLRNPRPGTNWF